MVQLEAVFDIGASAVKMCFNSSMVQLEGELESLIIPDALLFQFQYGTIRSALWTLE